MPRQSREHREKSAQAAAGYRHYRCPVPSCDWEGWLPRRSRKTVGGILRRRRAAARQRWLVPVLTTLSITAGAGALGVVAFRVLLQPPPAVTVRQAWVPGEHDEGKALPSAHPLRRYVALQLAAEGVADGMPAVALRAAQNKATALVLPAAGQAPLSAAGLKDSLTYRHGCVWGQPGRNPYRGTVEQALKAAVLPAEVVQKISQQVRLGSATDRVEISNAGIRAASSGRQFDASHFAMTYGMTLCTSTRVNFEPGHVEQASLYEASDKQGRVYAVMVPDVCGNVSVLADAEDRRRVTAVAGSSDDAAPEARAEPADAPEAGRAAGGPGVPGYVPGSGESAVSSSRAAARETGRTWAAGSADATSTVVGTSTPAPAPAPTTTVAPTPTPTPTAMADTPAGPQPAASAVAAAVTVLVTDNSPRRLPPEIDWKEPTSTTPGKNEGPREVNTVPEPGTLACAVLALGLMAGVGWRRRVNKR